jgi:hypothetical protein
VLYGLVQEHLATFVAHAARTYAAPLPRYVVAARRSATPRSRKNIPGQSDARQDDVYLRQADAPLCALCAAFDPLFRPMNEPPRRSRSRHIGSPRHSSSRSDPASFTYAPPKNALSMMIEEVPVYPR